MVIPVPTVPDVGETVILIAATGDAGMSTKQSEIMTASPSITRIFLCFIASSCIYNAKKRYWL